MTWVAPATLVGLVLGGVGGWVARGATAGAQAAPPVALSAVAVQQTTTGNLAPEVAKKLVESYMEASAKGADECHWDAVRRTSNKDWTFSDFDTDGKCAAALEKAGLAKRGACITPGCGGATGCCSRALELAGTSAWSSGDNGLWFPCGAMKFLKVTSVTTEGNKATIQYEREFTADSAILTSVSDCKLVQPEAGRRVRERKASRDDAGNWSITR